MKLLIQKFSGMQKTLICLALLYVLFISGTLYAQEPFESFALPEPAKAGDGALLKYVVIDPGKF